MKEFLPALSRAITWIACGSRVTFVGGHVRVCNPCAAFVWFQVAAIEALPRGLKVGLAAPASPGGIRITGNNGCVPVEGVAAAYLAGFCRFGVVVGVAHGGEVSKEDASDARE